MDALSSTLCSSDRCSFPRIPKTPPTTKPPPPPQPNFKSKPNLPLPATITHTSNALLSASAKSRPLDQTLSLLRLLPSRDTLTWNTALSACLRHRRPIAALRLFQQMLLQPSEPDELTLRSVLDASLAAGDLRLLLQLHAHIAKKRFESAVVNARLMGAYCELGLIDFARGVFDGYPRESVAYTVMSNGYVKAGRYEDALLLFVEMLERDGVDVDGYSFTCALRASAGIRCLLVGRQIHAQLVKVSNGGDVFVGTALVDMYVKCGERGFAEKAFADISEPSVVSWNALMTGGELESRDALALFFRMRDLGVRPDRVTFACLLRACKSDVGIGLVQQMHCLVVKSGEVEIDVYIGGALFKMYVDQGCVCEARRVFHEMGDKDTLAYNFAIEGCLHNGYRSEAVNLFHEALDIGLQINEATFTSLMVGVGCLTAGKQLHCLAVKFGFCNGENSEFIASALIRMYAEFLCLDDAIRLFERIQSPDVVTWTSLITGYSQNGESREALNLYKLMLLNELAVRPNNYTFASVLRSCEAEEGKQIHAQIVKSGESDLYISNGLLDMYAKCGYIEAAEILFNRMSNRDLPSWNAMITSLARHGYAEAAINVFHELLSCDKMAPNHITFMGLLSACNHRGLVDDGYRYFGLIEKPTIDHYACLIDLVGRTGRLKEARDLLERMPFEPNELIWSSVLSASSIHGDVEMAEYSAKHLLELNPTDSGTYVTLSNVYAAAKKWDEVKRIRKLMKDHSVRKVPGCSWLMVNGNTHLFSVTNGI
ncbi:putative pentatricopeptide repeat-containing protein [Acorus calamus]|uniref:Pentatricopeptide repeat-containing protein n=1 Tax=Acorus calamus TaxID=4465 RepID=A0AAV9D106_ACOCL|nr:putative pentatricopeptide repeat-containing protein [Acorus calamus]